MTDTTNEEVLDEITPFTDEADREIAYRAEGTPSSATPGERPAVIAPGAATGRRKEAIARVRLVPGTGQFKINGRTLYRWNGKWGAGCGELADIAASIRSSMASRKGWCIQSGHDLLTGV